MTTATRQRMTYAEYAAMPEDGHYYQLIGGELIMSPAPTERHQRISQIISAWLFFHVNSKRVGRVYSAPLDVVFSNDDVVQPDIVFVSRERFGIIAPTGLRGAPDLCVEVLSPSSVKLDRNQKRLMYAKHGVTELWIVDPAGKTVERFRLQENVEIPVEVLNERDVLRTELLAGFELKLADVFAE